jgi:hypothetical protein
MSEAFTRSPDHEFLQPALNLARSFGLEFKRFLKHSTVRISAVEDGIAFMTSKDVPSDVINVEFMANDVHQILYLYVLDNQLLEVEYWRGDGGPLQAPKGEIHPLRIFRDAELR